MAESAAGSPAESQTGPATSSERVPRPRRTLGPALALGVPAAALAVVAGGRPWAAVPGSPTAAVDVGGVRTVDGSVPLAGALALVLLACWGVLLVTRGRPRRLVALLGLAAAVGLVVTAVVGLLAAVSSVRDQLRASSAPAQRLAEVSLTGWGWACVAAAGLCVLAMVVAVRDAPRWPAMSSRYDAPAGTPGTARRETGGSGDGPDRVASDAPTSDLEVWKALDAGHDPTDASDGSPAP